MAQAKNISAGLLMYRKLGEEWQFFLVHPGGPYFEKKDAGWWMIPKGLPEAGEELLETAIREFGEETGLKPEGPYLPLGSIKQKGGKWVHAWAFEGEWQKEKGIRCNTFKVEWPYKSGRWQEYPEVDKAAWFTYEAACKYINAAQIPLLDTFIQKRPTPASAPKS
jgi:predicted NUDIX family NTP pyrophosphohydrolase